MNVKNFGYCESFNVSFDDDCFMVTYEKDLDKIVISQTNQGKNSEFDSKDVGWLLAGRFNDREKLFDYIFKNNILDINADNIFDIGMEFNNNDNYEGIYYEDNPFAFWCFIEAYTKPYERFKLLKWLSEQDNKYFEVD